MRARAMLAALAMTATVAGCTGVPHSSGPTIVESIGVEQPSGGEVPPPGRGLDPRTIVELFLSANGVADPARDGAYQFLTTQAKSHWDSSTVTIVDNLHVGLFLSGRVEVTGTQVGTIDRTGVYTPALAGDGLGNGGQPVTSSYGMQKVGGQWRINTLPNGLLITEGQFASYRQHPIYFFDSSEQQLVPDPRWTPPLDPTNLAQFLIGQLARGPRDNLQGDETTELPAQSDSTHVVVSTVTDGADGGLTKIEVPGTSQLGKATRNLLAAQIAHTLDPQVSTVGQMEITDGGAPVSIPSADGPVFTADEVTTPYLTSPDRVQLYYVDPNGGVVDEFGTPLPGRIGAGAYGLDSVALASRGTNTLLVAGTRKDHSLLDIGGLANNGQMVAAKLPAGVLSRPDWVPGTNEAWVGDGTKLYRITLSGAATAINLIEPSGIATARISAVRLSPEGSRVALVLSNTDGTAQIWVGSIVRVSGQVRVDSLTPISPQGVDITDVAWNDELKLFAVGHDVHSLSSSVYEVQVDGSLWTSDGLANLPSPPESITASLGLVAAVSSGGTIWEQSGASWTGVRGPGQDAKGTNPVYST